jgi:hypothetical protein
MSNKIIDVVGKKYNELTVTKFSRVKNKTTFWIVKCSCGKEKEIRKSGLGYIKSCGCYRRRKGDVAPKYVHGMSKTRFYRIWTGIKKRCDNKNGKIYKYYGGRGIRYTDEWGIFKNFYADMYNSYLKHSSIHGEKNTTIDRVNNDKGYYKINCEWATRKEQANNRRPKNTAIIKNLETIYKEV